LYTIGAAAPSSAAVARRFDVKNGKLRTHTATIFMPKRVIHADGISEEIERFPQHCKMGKWDAEKKTPL